MKRSLTVSTAVASWAEIARYTVEQGTQTDDGRVVFTADLGEIRRFIGIESDNWITIKDSDRLGPEYVVFAAPDIETVEKYLLASFGRTIRSRRNLPRIQLPTTADRVASGFGLATKDFRGEDRIALVDSGGAVVAFSRSDPIIATLELVRLSYHLKASVDDIKTSYLDPAGSPLFHRETP